jgi:GNAT superfamily N-acetyltransferase
MPLSTTVLPAPDRLFTAMERTWPPYRAEVRDGWTIRAGAGGGQRVSAATRTEGGARIDDAVQAMLALGQRPLFMLRPGEDDLDGDLARAGFLLNDPVVFLAAPVAALASLDPRGLRAIRVGCPLRALADIWATGGIGPARLAVMDRVSVPKTMLMGRAGDRPAAAAFVAADGAVAMLHALEVAEPHRRQGMGRDLLGGAASWAAEQGAEVLALAVTEANVPARALYEGAGMLPAGRYHYRVAA